MPASFTERARQLFYGLLWSSFSAGVGAAAGAITNYYIENPVKFYLLPAVFDILHKSSVLTIYDDEDLSNIMSFKYDDAASIEYSVRFQADSPHISGTLTQRENHVDVRNRMMDVEGYHRGDYIILLTPSSRPERKLGGVLFAVPFQDVMIGRWTSPVQKSSGSVECEIAQQWVVFGDNKFRPDFAKMLRLFVENNPSLAAGLRGSQVNVGTNKAAEGELTDNKPKDTDVKTIIRARSQLEGCGVDVKSQSK